MSRRTALFGYICAPILAGSGAAEAAPVTIQLSTSYDGITNLTYQGAQYVSMPYPNAPKGTFHLMTKFAGDTSLVDVSPTSVSLNGSTLTNTYSWGTASCNYVTATDNKIVFAYTITNTSSRALDQIKIHVLDLQFPSLEAPAGWNNDWFPGVFNNQQPQVVMAGYNTGTLAVVQPDTVRAGNFQVYFSHRYYYGYPLNLVSFNQVAPGSSDQFQVEIRFGPSGTWSGDLARDVLNAFERLNPQTNTWLDRRPIGQDFLAVVDKQWPTNPRGWLNDNTINVFTASGLVTFKTRMFQHASTLIQLAKQMSAQGIIFWDIEGEQYPQGVSTFAGDPRLLSTLAPEMDGIANEFLGLFSSQALRVGLTVRAQQIVFRPDGSFFQRDWPVGNNDAVVNDLDSKISYAIARWGCSIFYVDTNTWPNNNYDNVSVFQRLQQKYPKVLICPEFHAMKYYTCVAPYLEMRRGFFGTSANDYNVFPGAFSLVNVADGDMRQTAKIAQSIARGDIMLYRAWYQNNEFTTIQQLYRQITATPKPVAFPNDYQALAGAQNVYYATSNGFVLGKPNGTLQILNTTSPQKGGTATIQNNELIYTAPSTPGISDSVTITVTDGNSVTTTPIGVTTATATP
jgi:hypothetical protein